MVRVPRCMSTQHPDNASVPFFSSSSILAGEDEIREAFYAYSHAGCDEQMWDVEGKEIDTYVVKKLLTYYPEYFLEHALGEELRLTLRVPNPAIETAEAKILLETLESVPRSYDAARLFYGRDIAPIFEIILPMTTSAQCIERIWRYYSRQIVERQHARLWEGDVTIAEWIGRFLPERIGVIPLFEDVPSMLAAADIVEEYLGDKDIADQRVFLARSDTAMNYGLVSAALANKIALARLYAMAAARGVRIHPILGVGSAPFRGGLSPLTAERVGGEYPSVATFTIQSAFKYDYPIDKVREACERLRARQIRPAAPIDTERALAVMTRYSAAYRRRVAEIAPQINQAARYVPARRARKLHIGLFGYARRLDGITLPRAIAFTCALYSLGLPPELIALEALDEADTAFVREAYPSFDAEIAGALRYADLEGPLMTAPLREAIGRLGPAPEADPGHLEIVRRFREEIDGGDSPQLTDLVNRAALRRRFIG